MNMLRGVREYEPTKGTVIYTVAMCQNEECGWAEMPSLAGRKCEKCGSTLRGDRFLGHSRDYKIQKLV